MSQPNYNEHDGHRPAANELTPVERALAQVAPRRVQLDRDRLMFLAGEASTQRESGVGDPASGIGVRSRSGSWPWPAATAALAATSLALAVALVVRPSPRVEIVYVERSALPHAAEMQTATELPQAALTQPVVATDRPPARRVPPTRPPAIPANNYVRTRDVALRLGLDALGNPRGLGGGDRAPTYQEWRHSMFGPESEEADPMSYFSPHL